MTTTHGYLCAPPGDGGEGGGTPPPRRRKPPTHGELPIVRPQDLAGCNVDPNMPLQVALNKATMIKFWAGILATLLVSISAILAFYWRGHYQTEAHIGDGSIHLKSGERATLETKVEAQEHRRNLVDGVKAELRLQQREIIVQQKAQIQKIGEDLKADQDAKLGRILQEVQRTRQDVRRSDRSDTR